ncbi:ectoine hydroxylase [Actinomarinicola tropica]|uniref:Ectoine hydroxylase n=1 Tax=Actinomarinicola tropica TaxID=2789776 RepID=A0A5Q2RTB6_9ACTN|nr:ectoine hydroxylase [Actinomarinicola tropica]
MVDDYPSRIDTSAGLMPRLDPVLHDPRGTDTPGPLTPEQLASFERDGFVVLDGAFSDGEMDACMRELEAFGRDPARRARPETIVEPESDSVRSVFAVHRDSEVFSDLATDPRIADVARQILGSDAYVHQSRVNLKPAMTGKEFFWHSDFETWHVEDGMPRMRAVSASVAMTDNTEFNGPLMLVPGSHKWYVTTVGETPERHYETSLRRQEIGVPDEESLRRLVDEGGIVAPKAQRGAVIFFDCNTMHASGVNLSPYPRSNAFFVFNSVENLVVDPFSGQEPRPEHIASRQRIEPLG